VSAPVPADAAPRAITGVMILATDRLLLREMEIADLDPVATMLGDPEVMRHWPRPYTRAEAREWILKQRERYARDGRGYWLAIERRTGDIVGQAGILSMEVNRRPEVALGYILGRDYWGLGYATEAAAVARDHAFATTGHDRVVALIRPVNLLSLAVARRLGMRPVGRTMHSNLDHLVLAVGRTARSGTS
jgi:RimJ/RimL family protein N-acetyltransferase